MLRILPPNDKHQLMLLERIEINPQNVYVEDLPFAVERYLQRQPQSLRWNRPKYVQPFALTEEGIVRLANLSLHEFIARNFDQLSKPSDLDCLAFFLGGPAHGQICKVIGTCLSYPVYKQRYDWQIQPNDQILMPPLERVEYVASDFLITWPAQHERILRIMTSDRFRAAATHAAKFLVMTHREKCDA